MECFFCVLLSFSVFFCSFVDLNLIMEIYVNYASIIYQKHTHTQQKQRALTKSIEHFITQCVNDRLRLHFSIHTNQTLKPVNEFSMQHEKQAKCVFCFNSNEKKKFNFIHLRCNFCMNERFDVN